MPRRTTAALEVDALASLTEALAYLGVAANVLARESRDGNAAVDASVEVAGQRFDVEVKSVVTAAHGEQIARSGGREAPLLVVADRIAADAKRSLREAGVNYLDRRGELRIVAPPLIIDTVVESRLPIAGGSGESLDSQVANEVAICCLLTPNQPHGVRQIARYIDRAPSAVSNAMTGLREDGLLTSAGEAMIPDLFHELLAVWRRRAVSLAAAPPVGPCVGGRLAVWRRRAVSLAALPGTGARDAQRLGLGLDKPETSTGWALTDTRGAASWGIPIIARGDYPPDFYVPSESSLRASRSLLGDATDPAARACTVAVAPVRLACLHRVDHSQTSGERWPVANHIVVALDIAQERARGLEAIEQWKPDRIVRAW